MFRVITPEDVQIKMALPNLEGARPVVEEAITAAQMRMEAELGTRLTRGSITEVYNCDLTMNGMVQDGQFRLLLSRCFVVENTVGVTIEGLDVTNECTIRPVRGLIYIPEDLATDKDVTVEYDYGFTDGDTVPDWLREAVISYVPAAFYMGNPDVRQDASSAEVIKQAAAHSLSVLSPHSRKVNLVIRPKFMAD